MNYLVITKIYKKKKKVNEENVKKKIKERKMTQISKTMRSLFTLSPHFLKYI